MRRFGLEAALLVALVLVLAPGCDTKQPLRTGSSLVSISFRAQAIQAARWDVYELWDDVDGDGVPDQRRTDSPTSFCVPRPGPSESGRVPWAFAAEVSVLRAGETTPEIIGTTFLGGGTSYTNFTEYSTAYGPTPPPRAPSGTIHFLNPVNVTSAAFEYVTGQGQDCGNFPADQLLPTNLFGLSPALIEIELERGDTVLVSARKIDAANQQFFGPTFASEPTLSASLLVDGDVAPDAIGQFDTEVGVPGAGLAFSFTLN